MYDSFSSDYDRFVNWESRLAFEMPFLERQLQDANCSSVLDTAAGTGMHTIELRERGYIADGCDFSKGMVEKARSNADIAGISANFQVAGFGEVAKKMAKDQIYDAVLCLGNSLSHLENIAEIENALRDFAACLRPGGLLLIQNRNFEPVLAHKQRWMEPQSYQEKDQEWIFLRFYDFDAGGLINFHVVTLKRSNANTWDQKINSTWLYPLKQVEFIEAMEKNGFKQIELFGGMDGTAYDPEGSGNLVISARKK